MKCLCGNEGGPGFAFTFIETPGAHQCIKVPCEYITGGAIKFVDLYACDKCGTVKMVQRPDCPDSKGHTVWDGVSGKWMTMAEYMAATEKR